MKIQISSLCEKYFSSYITLINKNNNKINISLILDPSECLLDLSQTITTFLNYLWESPNFIAKIILNSDLTDVKNILFPFIYNRLYQNILSAKSIEENLLYIISILLKKEIFNNKFEHINFFEDFLYDYLIDELRRNNEIKKYAKEIIYEVIKKIEYDYYNETIVFDINITEEKLKLKKGLNIKSEDKEDFIYNLSKEELEKIIKNTKKQSIEEYISHLINMVEKGNNINLFSNTLLIGKIKEENISLFNKIYISKITLLLDILFEKLTNVIIPVELKYISKIIYVLTLHKFHNAKAYEIYSFIGKNFLNKLLIPLFKEPLDIFFNEFLISENTKQNLNFFCHIFTQLISLDLFENNEKEFIYTPFNNYFLNKIPEIFKFFENIIKV